MSLGLDHPLQRWTSAVPDSSKPLVAHEDFDGVIAPGKVNAGLILKSPDTLALLEHRECQFFGNDDHAVIRSENEVTRVDQDRLSQLTRKTYRYLRVDHDVAA